LKLQPFPFCAFHFVPNSMELVEIIDMGQQSVAGENIDAGQQ
jgi:hypothetical protein